MWNPLPCRSSASAVREHSPAERADRAPHVAHGDGAALVWMLRAWVPSKSAVAGTCTPACGGWSMSGVRRLAGSVATADGTAIEQVENSDRRRAARARHASRCNFQRSRRRSTTRDFPVASPGQRMSAPTPHVLDHLPGSNPRPAVVEGLDATEILRQKVGAGSVSLQR